MPELTRVPLYGKNLVVSECARCGRVRPVWSRGLCNSCHGGCHKRGEHTEYGYVKPDRVAEYARCRSSGDSIARAAARAGVSARTGDRYEAQLRAEGRAPWRVRPAASQC